jgi:hypothetical protein
MSANSSGLRGAGKQIATLEEKSKRDEDWKRDLRRFEQKWKDTMDEMDREKKSYEQKLFDARQAGEAKFVSAMREKELEVKEAQERAHRGTATLIEAKDELARLLSSTRAELASLEARLKKQLSDSGTERQKVVDEMSQVMRVHARRQTDTHTNTDTHTHTHTHTHTRTHARARAHTQTRAHTDARTHALVSSRVSLMPRDVFRRHPHLRCHRSTSFN